MGFLLHWQDRLFSSLKVIYTYLSLFKLRAVGLLVFVSLVSMLLSGGFEGRKFSFLLLSGILSCSGAFSLNHYLEKDIDALMTRTRNRPLPSGKLSPNTALTAGLLLLTSSIIISLITLNPLTTLFIISGALIYLVVYTIGLKRRHCLNIIIGGLGGSAPALAGWSAVSKEISFLPFFLAALVYLWIPYHIWSLALSYREDYQQALIPMIPTVINEKKAAKIIALNIILVFLLSLLPFFLKYSGWLYLIGAIGIGSVILYFGIGLITKPIPLSKINFKLSGVYLALLLLFLLLDKTF